MNGIRILGLISEVLALFHETATSEVGVIAKAKRGINRPTLDLISTRVSFEDDFDKSMF